MFRKKTPVNLGFKWLFVAFFQDGTTIVQREEDEIGHSRMIDVTAKEKESPLIAFELRHIDGKQAVTVDLVTGAFVVNGTPLEAQSDFSFEVGRHFNPIGQKLELAYWREKVEQANITATVQDDMSVESELEPTASYINRYFIGWKCGDKQAILAVG